jgi:predicted CoA-binding protein
VNSVTETADDETFRRIFNRDQVIAVVGASPNWDRPSCRIMQYMQAMEYRIFPVNPRAAGGEILGRKVYATLADVPEPVGMVNVFRKPDAVAEVTKQAIEIGARSIWMQDGVSDDQAAAAARAAGLDVVMDRCFKREHFRLFGGHRPAVGATSTRLDSKDTAA